MVTLLNTCFYHSSVVSEQKTAYKIQNVEKIICKAKKSEWGIRRRLNYNSRKTDRRGWSQYSGDGDAIGGDWVGTGTMVVRMGWRWESQLTNVFHGNCSIVTIYMPNELRS